MTDAWRPGYPACASSPEGEGGNFEPPVIGIPFQRGVKRLREAEAFNTVQREAHSFHERKARQYGLDNPVGLAHFKAARSYREVAGRLQEMFENGGEAGELPPAAIIQANKAAVGFHKKQAEKAGLDSDRGHAHVAALEHHLDIMNKAKQKQREAQFGHSGKESPVPVPKKSEQPSQDIRQDLPAVPLTKLQQKRASKEWGQKFGPSKGWGSPMKMSREALTRKHKLDGMMKVAKKHDAEGRHDVASRIRRKAISKFGEAGRIGMDLGCDYPRPVRRLAKPDLLFRGKRTEREAQEYGKKGMKWGVKQEKGKGVSDRALRSRARRLYDRTGGQLSRAQLSNLDRIQSETGVRVYPDDRKMVNALWKKHKHSLEESGQKPYVAPRYDKSHPEGFESPEYAGIKRMGEPGTKSTGGWPARQKRMHARMARDIARRATESRGGSPVAVVNSSPDNPFALPYEAPKRESGWRSGMAYSPPVKKVEEMMSGGLVIKEF